MATPNISDTFFISHGSPMLAVDESLPARHFLKSFREAVFRQKPTSILVISGHWETDHPVVTAVDGPCSTIYDFYNFPKPLYKLKYPAAGAPELANRVKKLLDEGGFKGVRVDKKRGLDHGAWIPLMLMYPDADIPVCQLSIQTNSDATHHFNMGRALAPLRKQGVLIIGSGSATHNLGKMERGDGPIPVAPWAEKFNNWLTDTLLSGRYEDANQYESKAPYAKLAHPWPDHFYPLHVAIGAAGGNSRAQVIHQSWTNATLSYASFRFTQPY